MALQEDEKNMNADNIQYVIGEVDETTTGSVLGAYIDEHEE
jgi:hypothetical protein